MSPASSNSVQGGVDISLVQNLLFLHPSDGPGSLSIQEKLVGAQNYRSWRRSVENALSTKRKLGFIRGTVPRSSDPALSEEWETCNNMVISWLMSFVSESIAKSIMFIGTAYEIWSQLAKRFALSNGSRKYKLNRETYDIVQAGQPISEYYTKMKCVWEELDSMNVLPRISNVTAEINAFLNVIHTPKEEQRLFQFLNGLDEHFSAKRSQLLLSSPLPSVEFACALLQQEESQREVFGRTLDSPMESTNLYTKTENKEKCSICGYKWHSADKCWEKIGYPVWHYKFKQNQAKNKGKSMVKQGGNQPRRTIVATAETSGHIMFTSKQFEQLMKSLPHFNSADMKYSTDTDEELDNEFVAGGTNHLIQSLHATAQRNFLYHKIWILLLFLLASYTIKKKLCSTKKKIDRLSDLEDGLLLDILSRLESTKEAIRTGVLSKRWQHLWPSVPNLIFHHQPENKPNLNPDPDFFSFVNHTLTQCRQLNLNGFLLSTKYDIQYESLVNEWIRYVVNLNVKEFDLMLDCFDIASQHNLDQICFINSHFTSLILYGCILKPIGDISWTNLKTLSLGFGKVDEDLIQNMLSGSPVLGDLTLIYVCGVRRIDISSKSVKTLWLGGFRESEHVIEINAPYIVSLHINRLLILPKLMLLNVSSLVKAELDYVARPDYSATADKELQEEILKGLILKLRLVKELQIGDLCLEPLSRLEAKGFTLPSNIKTNKT